MKRETNQNETTTKDYGRTMKRAIYFELKSVHELYVIIDTEIEVV
jgi:hypothetical protein